MLSLLSKQLDIQMIKHVTYDGGLSGSRREQVLSDIHTDDHCLVLLVSIMAGGVGLDITSCNNVILVEPWWNPFVEEQALARVHRICQRKQVNVYRLIVRNTIEDEIVDTQGRKSDMINSFLDSCVAPNPEPDRGKIK